MSVLDDLVREANKVMIIGTDKDSEDVQQEVYRKISELNPLPEELKGKPYLSLFIKHKGVPIKQSYITTAYELQNFITKFWEDIHHVEDNFENYKIEYYNHDVPVRRIFSDSFQFYIYVCRHLLHILDGCMEEIKINKEGLKRLTEEMRIDNKEVLKKLAEEFDIISEYERRFSSFTLFSDGEIIYGPSYELNLNEVYKNLLRKGTGRSYSISYELGDCLFDEYTCETLKEVFDLIFFELGFLFNSNWDEVIAHVVYGRKLPDKKGPDWFEKLYRI